MSPVYPKTLVQKAIRNPYNWYVAMLGLICLLPVLAPLLLKLSESAPLFVGPARLIYLIYSFTCHQFSSRSIHLFDYQIAWCARDTGIWLAIFVGALLVRIFNLKGLSWYWVIPFVVPIAMDGGIQTVATALNINPVGISGEALYISNNLIRFMSGATFGFGASMWLSPLMADTFIPAYHQLREKKLALSGIKQLGIVLGTLVGFFLVYVLLVAAWDVTSLKNKPSDWLDSAVKTPTVDFYTRRMDGACPTEGADIFSFNCN